MITTKISIKPHLAEYLTGRFYDHNRKCVRFDDKLDIYHTLWDLMVKRPDDCPIDEGNVEIFLPKRSEGKDPRSYNYLGERSVKILERRIEDMFYAELRAKYDEDKHRVGQGYADTAHEFLCKYKIESISSDALIKDYYRYRINVLKRTRSVRRYEKNKSKIN